MISVVLLACIIKGHTNASPGSPQRMTFLLAALQRCLPQPSSRWERVSRPPLMKRVILCRHRRGMKPLFWFAISTNDECKSGETPLCHGDSASPPASVKDRMKNRRGSSNVFQRNLVSCFSGVCWNNIMIAHRESFLPFERGSLMMKAF